MPSPQTDRKRPPAKIRYDPTHSGRVVPARSIAYPGLIQEFTGSCWVPIPWSGEIRLWSKIEVQVPALLICEIASMPSMSS